MDIGMKPELLKRKKPWLSSLVTTTILAVFFTLASQLWVDGRPEWAFVVFFSGLWILLSVFWSNAHYSEASGLVLADIVDHNFRKVSDRIDQLEQQLEEIAHRAVSSDQEAAKTPDRMMSGS